MIPEGSKVFEDSVLEINVKEDVDDGEFQKFLFLAMAMWIGIPILF
jgi:CRISPR/Cas system CSM-associated protein Csm2 small subunit